MNIEDQNSNEPQNKQLNILAVSGSAFTVTPPNVMLDTGKAKIVFDKQQIQVDDMLDVYGEELRCKICLEHKVNCIMPCGHTICTQCYKNDGLVPPPKNCPWCRETPAPDIRGLFFVGGYKEKYLKYKDKYIQLKNKL